jgi:signal transduction histidine kinase
MTTLGHLLTEECAHLEPEAAVTIARLEAANRRLCALAQFGREIRAELDPKALLALLPRYLVETAGCAGAAVVLFDPDLGTVGGVGAFGMAPSFAHSWQQALRAGDPAEGTELALVKETGRPVVFRDIANDPRLAAVREPILAAGARSSVAMPLIVREELLGALVAYYRLPWMASEEEVAYLGSMAEEAAAAIQNAWLYAQTRRELRRRDALRKVVAFISSELDLASLLERVAASAVELLDATGGGISLIDESGGARIRAVYNLPAELVGTLIRPGHGITGQVLATRAPVIVADYVSDLPRPLPELEDLHASIAVPIWWQKRLIGVFAVSDTDPSRLFADQDREMLELLANHVAIAIENARLYGEARGYAVMQERNRLARELHDSVTQSLFSVTLLCQSALGLWESHPARARERLERMNDLAQRALAEMRALIFQLRPMALQAEGLLSALKKHIAALRGREGLDVTLHVEGAERRLSAPLEEAAFRIVQESLNNVVKHAHVKWATVQLTFDEASLGICTEDQGAGFNPTGRHRHRTLGMASMRERAEEVGGNLQVESAPGRGTRVFANLPVLSREVDGNQQNRCLGLSQSFG